MYQPSEVTQRYGSHDESQSSSLKYISIKCHFLAFNSILYLCLKYILKLHVCIYCIYVTDYWIQYSER